MIPVQVVPAQVALVRDSFRKVVVVSGASAELFYARLFETAPEVRPLFPQDMTEQKKKLMQMLGIAVSNLHQIETILPAVEELGRRHAAYGVQEAHYDLVGAALMHSLGQGLGEDWTPELAEAWAGAYAALAGVMQDAARPQP